MSGPGTATAPASGEHVARVLAGAHAALAARVDEVNDLNVFPVADGDTGTNMLLTAAAVEQAAAATTGLARAERAAALSRAALVGARGNSGMILSQLVRGAAEALARDDGPLDGAALTRALRAASDAAYGAVRAPVEGTMLTVARRIAERAEETGGDLAAVLDAALAGGRDGVAETPSLLPVLAAAGVVDSGGLGVTILLEGVAAALTGREPPAAPGGTAPRAPAADHPPSRHRYCTTFLVEGAGMDLDALEGALRAHGDSLLVMGDDRQAKVHIHTDAPERAAAAAGTVGSVDALRWDDMRRQEAARTARLAPRDTPPAACAAVVVADGAGVRELAEGLGARAVAPGGGAAAVAGAVAGLAPAGVVVLATGADAASAGAAAGGAEVVDSGSPAALLAALVELDPAGDAAEVAAAMRAAVAAVEVIDVDGDDLRVALTAALAPVLAGRGPSLVTVLVGRDAGVDPVVVEGWVRAAAGDGDVEVEAHDGGQAAPALAVGVE